jgi:hypothetical protein
MHSDISPSLKPEKISQAGKVSERQLRVAPNTPGTFGLEKYGKISQIKR